MCCYFQVIIYTNDQIDFSHKVSASKQLSLTLLFCTSGSKIVDLCLDCNKPFASFVPLGFDLTSCISRVFFEIYKNGNNANIGNRGFTM